MPRRKPMSRNRKGITLVRPYEPNKANEQAWRQCLENDEYIGILMTGERSYLDGYDKDFESEEQQVAAWENNRQMLMSLKGTAWNGNINHEKVYGYCVGNRPWGFWKYDRGLDIRPFNHLSNTYHDFDSRQYHYLLRHGLLEPGEEKRVEALRVWIEEVKK